MARIAGINIPDNKKIEIALTYIFGIGRVSAKKILEQTKINTSLRAKDLNQDQINILKEAIEKQFKIEGELKRDILNATRRLRDIGTWRGLRHAKRLPVRGQKTKTNSRTVRGNVRRTVGSGRKVAPGPK